MNKMLGRRRNLLNAVLVGVLATLLAACSGIPVNTDYDTSRDFASLKTYAWLEPSQKLLTDPLVDNDLMTARIKRSVQAELRKRGYTQASGSEGADFLITYHVSSEDKISVDSFHGHYGYYPCWGCFGPGFGYDRDIHVRQYKQGTFMLDVIDPASEKLMWRGTAGQRLNTGTPEERDAYVRSIVTAILEKFPPGNAG